MEMNNRPLNVLWLIDHVCYDGSLHGGGRLYWNLLPKFNPDRVIVHPYFLRASQAVREVFRSSPSPVTILEKHKYDLSTVLTLSRICRRNRIDVMHLFCYASSTFGRIVGLLKNIPTVIHDFDTQIYFPYPFYLRIMDRVLAPRTSWGIAASPMCRAYMHKIRRIPAERIELMPHAIPSAKISAAAKHDKITARNKLGWQENRIVFCAATKLGPDRGNKTLLRAFARVAAKSPIAYLVIVYKPTYYHRIPTEYEHLNHRLDATSMRQEIDELIVELGISAQVELVEALDSPEVYFAASDIMVAPFLHERFSSVNLVEGLAFGCPLIGSNIGEQKEIIQNDVNGLLVKPGDETELGNAMTRFLKNEPDRNRMSESARCSAEMFSVSTAAKRLEKLYHSLKAAV